ncbi:Aste57867_11134 [Aphanomyces stellatus]|uniref:Aste57867_11134 protein n=1 Tax=Aphanomyces stellatus TaxID=120398 RepID=A0A485KSQ3_9STRA|nr:hypothetical protein As57867_011092 [Aphanomyces stellatus]VFT88001.1 Aste57867_11134 [Aphanomyces stellatus]
MADTTLNTAAFRFQVQYCFQQCFTRASTWQLRSFTVNGANLSILDTLNHQLHCLPVKHISLGHLSGHTYHLKKQGRALLIISCPSPTVWAAFQAVLDVAKMVPACVRSNQASDPWAKHMEVAHTILATEATSPAPVSKMSVAKFQAVIAPLEDMYDCLVGATRVEHVYDKLLALEHDYSTHSKKNFAHLVVGHYRVLYHKSVWKPNLGGQRSLQYILSRCPHGACRGQLSLAMAFAMHIEEATTRCPHCKATLNYRMFQLSELLRVTKWIQLDDSPLSVQVPLPAIPHNGSLEAFLAGCATAIIMQDSSTQPRLLDVLNAKLDLFLNRCLGAFEFDVVHTMLQDVRDLGNWSGTAAMCANFDYWSRPHVIQASLVRYHKLMHLFKTTNFLVHLSQTFDIVLAWFAHSCYPDDYRAYYRKATGRTLEMAPYDPDNIPIPTDTIATRSADTYYEWTRQYDESFMPLPPPYTKQPKGDQHPAPPKVNPFQQLGIDDIGSVDSAFGLKPDNSNEMMHPVIGTPWLYEVHPSLRTHLPILFELKDRWKRASVAGYTNGWPKAPVRVTIANQSCQKP